jgi:hypothetical protein
MPRGTGVPPVGLRNGPRPISREISRAAHRQDADATWHGRPARGPSQRAPSD